MGTIQNSRNLFSVLVVFLAVGALTRPMTGACPPDPVRIKAGDPDPFDSFGRAVGVYGDTVAVGAFWDDENGADAGAVYVFRREGSAWVQAEKLLASDGHANDRLGRAVVIGEETIMARATGSRVYVYQSDGSSWMEEEQLTPSDGPRGGGGGFGWSLGISADVAVIGAPNDDDNGTNSGSAYVFRFDGSKWWEEQELFGSGPTTSDGLGLSVAVSGVVIVAGSPGHDGVNPESPICDSGAAYVFRLNEEAETWEEQTKLTASDAACSDRFGSAVSVSGDAVVAGARLHDDNGAFSGAAYMFHFDAETSEWVEEQKLLASDGLPGDQFGSTVAIDRDLAVIGAPFADPLGSSSGAAYVFRRNALGVWIEQCKLVPNPNPWGQDFAVSLDIEGQRVIIGATGEDQLQGAAYIFDLSFNPADLDADGTVGAFDLALLLGSWGPCPEPCTPGDPTQTCPADLDADCLVGASDLAILLGNWG